MGIIGPSAEDLAQDCRGGSSAGPRLEGSLAELGNVDRGSVNAGPGIHVGRRKVRHLFIGHGLGLGVSRSLGQGLSLGISRRLGQGLSQLPLGGTPTVLTRRARGSPDRRRARPGSSRVGYTIMANSNGSLEAVDCRIHTVRYDMVLESRSGGQIGRAHV